ncbi:hypothetical protein ACWDR1_29185 [Streptosporangium sandarakinum]
MTDHIERPTNATSSAAGNDFTEERIYLINESEMNELRYVRAIRRAVHLIRCAGDHKESPDSFREMWAAIGAEQEITAMAIAYITASMVDDLAGIHSDANNHGKRVRALRKYAGL